MDDPLNLCPVIKKKLDQLICPLRHGWTRDKSAESVVYLPHYRSNYQNGVCTYRGAVSKLEGLDL